MEHVLVLILSAALIYLLCRRVHFHFSFKLSVTESPKLRVANPPSAARKERPAPVAAAPAVPMPNPDIVSALVNLGTKTTRAREIALKVCRSSKDFDVQLREAIKLASAA